RKSRPSLGVGADRVRKVNDHVGLHPSMEGFSKLIEDGRVGIVQGGVHPQPDRSHFSSMDIWHTARPDLYSAKSTGGSHRVTGWIGRCLDCAASKHAGGDMPGLHLGGGRLPLALVGDEIRVSSVGALEGFKLEDGGDARIRDAMRQARVARR